MEFDNEGNLIEPGSSRSAYTASGELKEQPEGPQGAVETPPAASEGEPRQDESSAGASEEESKNENA
jgi:hypothetical protein